MIDTNGPPLYLNSSKNNQKETSLNSIVWDDALEDLLSQPITSNLESKQVSWKKATKIKAKSIPIDVKSAFDTEEAQVHSTPSSIKPRSKTRNHEIKSRELMIKNIIQTPITPRKKLPFPQTGSTKANKKVKTCLYDKKEIETIMYNRNQRPQPIAQRPVKKIEHASLTRAFDFHIPSAVRSMMCSRNSYFG